MIKKIETDKFIISYSSKLEHIVKDMISLTNENYDDILDFFEIKILEK